MLEPPAAGAMANVTVVDTSIAAGGAGGQSGDPELAGAVQTLMWDAVGLIRDGRHLGPAVEQLASWSAGSDLALLGYLIASAALRREESRGGHYRTDFPARDDLHWRIHVAQRRPL
jgi:L-aspartate oxidase